MHGDPGPANIRMTSAGAGLLDWDEARVDYTDLDLADLPEGDPPARYLPPVRLAAARSAVRAWEAASGWRAEPSYARRQLAQLPLPPPEGAGPSLHRKKSFLPRLDVAAGSSCDYHAGLSSSSDEMPGLRR